MAKPLQKISVKAAKELQERWWKTRSKVITDGEEHRDTCEFKFSIAELQEYLDYVKEKSARQGIKDPGISIWLGAYAKTEEKPGLTTLFFSATKESAAEDCRYESNDEIEPSNEITGKWPPEPYGG
ncbi:hypothetical protein RM553_15940 [Zunongwangia sp. F363]|uniref:Uncharacterized protein n=1 Tax=Autumnicola tepida TaxID=3075595 RepID=A0ABU3CDC1_9FLAO|nr:hypothetical protein [Zunongwangia sp. F363]MDT0644330.1 hypothetical protein [Zunongwangia sp. F363]